MAYVNLQISEQQLQRTSELARRAGLQRTEYIRRALDHFNRENERKLLSEQFAQSSAACRRSSLQTCREFEVADFRLEELGGMIERGWRG
ncbi:MAG: hypothetical protein HY318_06905 [Armatimonadetes bacterium]|nr:hypothetical protein [Armatimonadota bacterium]